MPVLSGALKDEGALVDVLVGWSIAKAQRLRAALRLVPPPIEARALIDTGAEVTCVDSTLVQALDLPLAGVILANLPAAGGLRAGTQHNASLRIRHPSPNARLDLFLSDLDVVELPLARLGYEALIGRDVLAACKLLYNGPEGRFRPSY